MKLDPLLGFRFAHVTLSSESSEAKTLLDCIFSKKDIATGFDVLKKFPIVWKWYELIAMENGLSPEHSLVAEAYWIGNSLLERPYNFSDIHKFITSKFSHVKTLNPPQPGTFPHHNPGHVQTYGILRNPNASVEERADCLVRLGTVLEDGSVRDAITLISTTPANTYGLPLESGTQVVTHRKTICAVLDNSDVKRFINYGVSQNKKYFS